MTTIKTILGDWYKAAVEKLRIILPDAILALRRQIVRTAMPFVWVWLGTIGADRLVDRGQLEDWAFLATGTAVYAALAALERRWPWFGRLLGSKGAPMYDPNTGTGTTGEVTVQVDIAANPPKAAKSPKSQWRKNRLI